MKLYATVKSERARKNQGGNKYVDIDLFTGSVDESKHFANVRLNIIDGVYTLWLDGEIVKQDKGERQKGETLEHCPECGHSMTDLGDVLVCDNESCGNNLKK